MDSIEKIGSVIPKLKYQLIFLKERESLMSMMNSDPLNTTDHSSALPSISTASKFTHQAASDDNASSTKSTIDNKGNAVFPDKYIIPQMPTSLLKDIDDGQLHKFGSHYTNRQILIDTITHDLIDRFQLL